MKRKIRAVFFDYDGTLINSMPEIYKGVRAVLAACGKEIQDFPEFCRTFHAPYMEWYVRQGVDLPGDEIRRIYFSSMESDKAAYFPETSRVLERLKRDGFHTGIVSAHGYPDVIRNRLVSDGLLGEYDWVIGKANEKAPALRLLCESLKIEPEEMLFVGDLISDILDGHEAGVLTAAYLHPHGHRSSFEVKEPHYYLERSLEEIFDHVEIAGV